MRRCVQCLRVFEDVVQFCPRDGMALPPPDTLIGRVLDDKYRIDALQGLGGMGAVYRGTQLNLERTVAVKIVKGDFLADEQVTERFRREAFAVGRLNHSNVVTVYDFGVLTDVGAYLVMEFLQGKTLRQAIKDDGRIELERAVDLITQTCSAVYAAHVEGIIHRDLKPDNIFLQLCVDGSTQAKVLDFGVAKFTGVPDPLGLELTVTGMVIGTPVYMSPEQCQGQEIDARSDIYSLGCVLYEMLTGRPPFSANSGSAVVVKHATEPPMPPSSIVSDIPPGVEAAILKALEKKPEDRFDSAAAMAEAIEAAIRGDYVPPSSAGSVSTNGESGDSLIDRLFPSADRTSGPRIAVLPFNNVTRDSRVEFLGFALADAMITELSCEPSLVVRPSSAVAKYAEAFPEHDQAKAELDVDLLTVGNFLLEGDKFQLNVQLVELDENAVIWQQRVAGDYAGSIALQQEVVHDLVEGMCSRLNLWQDTHTTGTRAASGSRSRDPVATELLEQSRLLHDSPADRIQAIELLERSVALDPDNAEAWSELASRYYYESQQLDATRAELELALRSAQRALAIDHTQLGSVIALGRMLVESGEAEALARRASATIKSDPDRSGAHYALGYALRFGGLLDSALSEVRLASDIPDDLVNEEVAAVYVQKDLFQDARRVLVKASRVTALFLRAVSEAMAGDTDSARSSVEEMERVDPEHLWTAMARAFVDRSDASLSGLKADSVANGEAQCWLACIYARMGRSREAVERLRAAVDRGYFNFQFFSNSILFDAIREDANAIEVLERARQRHENFLSGELLPTNG